MSDRLQAERSWRGRAPPPNSGCPHSSMLGTVVAMDVPVLTTRPGRLRKAVAIVAMAIAPIIFIPTGAEAATTAGCVQDRQICLYDNSGTFVGAYRDSSETWQHFERTRTAYAKNLFPEAGLDTHVVYFRHGPEPDALTTCVEPAHGSVVNLPDKGVVSAVMIRPGATCYPGGRIA